MGRVFGHLAKLLNLTATPGTVTSGDVWYQSTADQVLVSDGAAGEPIRVGPYGTHPVIRPAGWHSIPPFGNAASANVPDGRMFAMPFWPGRTCTLTAIAANTTLALVGGNLRMGIYRSDGVFPTTLLSDFGVVSAGILGIRQISGLSVAVRPVLHFLICGRQGGVLNLGVSTRNTWDPVVSDDIPVIAANRNAYYIDGVGGALPANFGAPAGTDTGAALTVQLV
jgi:hypothetical protein